MKFHKKVLSLVTAIVLLAIAVVPASAQLGDTDVSSFVVQNISGTNNVQVTIQFVSEAGAITQPLTLGGSITNPFSLDDGESQNIYVPDVPGLSSGRYSVIISSTAKVVAYATVGGTGTRRFSGSYSGFSSGASPFYLPSSYFNFYGWYSMISVQNLGGGDADVTVTITCENGTVGTLSTLNLPSYASKTWALKNTTPTGFTGSTICRGSAVVTADQPVVATDNQSKPTNGNTLSYVGQSSGTDKIYVPALYNSFSGWNGSLIVRKLNAGDTTVTISFSDTGGTTCNLGDTGGKKPFCMLYMPDYHPTTGAFGATITSTGGMPLVVIANATKGTLSLSYNGFGAGTATNKVALPSLYKAYYNWNSSVSCQNVGTVNTTLNVSYQGYTGSAYNTTTTLTPGDVERLYTPGESFLPIGYIGGTTITANSPGAQIACIGNLTNNNYLNPTKPGDWSTSYNGFNR